VPVRWSPRCLKTCRTHEGKLSENLTTTGPMLQTPSLNRSGRPTDRLQERDVVERLLEDLHRARGERPGAHVRIGVRGHEDDGNFGARGEKPLLELEATHSPHPHVEEETAGVRWTPWTEELLRRREEIYPEPGRPQERLQRLPKGLVIVNNRHSRTVEHAL